jgi:MYXO-CTERM domain-containing protein
VTSSDTDCDDPGESITSLATDCDDDDIDTYLGALETCDAVDNDCDGTVDEGTSLYDDDGDGYSEDEGDCDDANNTTYPSECESSWTPNGVDDDCDGEVDEDLDEDGDGFRPCSTSNVHGYDSASLDCDDGNPGVYLYAREICDGFDNNCDGEIDEGLTYCDGDTGGDDTGVDKQPPGGCSVSSAGLFAPFLLLAGALRRRRQI